MKYEEVSWYSDRVKKNMSIKIYGHYGIPIIVFPSLLKSSDEFYCNGTLDALNDLIDSGKIKLFCLDSNDSDTVASSNNDLGYRSFMLKMYHEYVYKEVFPFIYNRQGGYAEPIALGVSMGATHSAISFLNHPELYSGILAISGGYNLNKFFNDYMDDDLYFASLVHFMGGMKEDNNLINIYNKKKMIFICGTGSYEHLVLNSNYELKNSFIRLKMNAEFNILGSDFIHDWSSWNYLIRKNLEYFL